MMKKIIEDVRKGKIVIIADDELRENEGDLFVAAEKITPEIVNFMATHGRGLICMPMTKRLADKLNISLMVKQEENTEKEKCKFGVSIDARETGTGISAFDRAFTIRKALNGKAEDFRRPGHIFPLIAEDKGVFVRQGHTEAAVDLAALAELGKAGVICEIMNEDGTMAHGDELREFAEKHHLRIVSIQDILQYRIEHEKLIEKKVDVKLPTVHGEFRLYAFLNKITGSEDLVLVKGNVSGNDVLVRLHSECLTGEVFGSLRCDCDEQLHTALSAIEREGRGVIIYLRQEGRGIGLLNKLKAYQLQDQGKDTVEANEQLGLKADAREYGIAAQLLKEFGVTSVRLLTNNLDKKKQLEAYGIVVMEVLPLETMPCRHNLKYLEAKQLKMGHVMDIKDKLIFS